VLEKLSEKVHSSPALLQSCRGIGKQMFDDTHEGLGWSVGRETVVQKLPALLSAAHGAAPFVIE
jgi:hypothetical protein